jgi:hypothetical protein
VFLSVTITRANIQRNYWIWSVARLVIKTITTIPSFEITSVTSAFCCISAFVLGALNMGTSSLMFTMYIPTCYTAKPIITQRQAYSSGNISCRRACREISPLRVCVDWFRQDLWLYLSPKARWITIRLVVVRIECLILCPGRRHFIGKLLKYC